MADELDSLLEVMLDWDWEAEEEEDEGVEEVLWDDVDVVAEVVDDLGSCVLRPETIGVDTPAQTSSTN